MPHIMIWPDVYREHGHWIPHISLALSLEASGFTTEFMGIPDTAVTLQPYPLNFTPILETIYPTGYSLENKLEPRDQRWKPHHVMPLVRGALDAIFDPGVASNPPDLLVAGYFTGLESLILHHKYQVPLVVTTTFLRPPSEGPAMHAKVKLVRMSRSLRRSIIEGATGGPMALDEFLQPLKTAPELIPCPQELDFQEAGWVHHPQVHYVEPMNQRPPASIPSTIPSDVPLIVGSAGSQVPDYEDAAKQLFANLIEMMRSSGMGNYHLVLTVGDRLLPKLQAEVGPTLPSNVSLFSWVSLLDVMRSRDVAVAFVHGGLATLKECIAQAVPMVVVPLGKDQHGNALRIRRQGIGLTTSVEATPTQLRRLVLDATGNTWRKRALTKLAGVFNARDDLTPTPSVQVIQGLLAVPS